MVRSLYIDDLCVNFRCMTSKDLTSFWIFLIISKWCTLVLESLYHIKERHDTLLVHIFLMHQNYLIFVRLETV